jgi:hypothetical protein
MSWHHIWLPLKSYVIIEFDDQSVGMMSFLSHADDGGAEAMLATTRCRCRVILAMSLPSHASDGAAESCWR